MKRIVCTFLLVAQITILLSCNEESKNVGEIAIVATPEQINSKAEEVIQATLEDLLGNKELADSFQLKNTPLIDSIYEEKNFAPIWSSEGNYTRHADSLYNIIQNARLYGLFPNDYYADKLTELRQAVSTDSLKKMDASKWALNDLLLTSAFTQLVRDLKAGRIVPDSIMKRDTVNTGSFLLHRLDSFIQNPSVEIFNQLEPKHKEYAELKEALKNFLDRANLRNYTYIHAYDSGTLKHLIYKRIDEEDSIQLEEVVIDSIYLADAIRKYQKLKKLKVDGKISSELIKKLNDTDEEKFIRIAITMDRYKMLSSLPDQYIWVNIPSYQLKVKRRDSVLLTSKVAVGKTYTRTPEIVSAITDMITYPQWTIPASIIEKEILPGLKRDAGYTNKKGYSIIDKEGNVVDPYFIDWSKYKKGIPYKVVQGSGDANALGVIKFNFPNKHLVYLHDTNQRYLFSRKNRAISHGCVRVESWKDLAYFILESDSLSGSSYLPKDSLNNWLSLKQKKVIPVRSRVPVYIKYFTCEGLYGKVVFYDDIYEDDRKLRNKYFATK